MYNVHAVFSYLLLLLKNILFCQNWPNISYIDRVDLDMVHQDERSNKYTKVTSEPMGAYVWSAVLHFDRLNMRLKLKPSKNPRFLKE